MSRWMVPIRRLEEEFGRLHREGRTRGPIRRRDGQEAVGIGATAALAPEEVVTSADRARAQPVGTGLPLGPLVADIFGRGTGGCGDRAGLGPVADPARGPFGRWAARAVCCRCGPAWPVALSGGGEPRPVRALPADGAAQIDVAREPAHLAGGWRPPMIFVREGGHLGRTLPTAAGPTRSTSRSAPPPAESDPALGPLLVLRRGHGRQPRTWRRVRGGDRRRWEGGSQVRFAGPCCLAPLDLLDRFRAERLLPEHVDGSDPLAETLLADPAGLPPLLATAAELDPLLDRSRSPAARPAEVGLRHALAIRPNLDHDARVVTRAFDAPVSTLERLGKKLRRLLQEDTP
ncbi:MAG: hypothetical protein N3D77_03670 [Geminicoccaceae bacterium]|nr:hypothetical protein [Geminicoccaceae bacterium]